LTKNLSTSALFAQEFVQAEEEDIRVQKLMRDLVAACTNLKFMTVLASTLPVGSNEPK
jgi:hypothetical protein